MLEKVVENWLDNTTERAFQDPFCACLIADGHEILFSSDHDPLEHGKDVVSRDSNGTIFAYQLKSGNRITSRIWREELLLQLYQLVNQSIRLPSLGEIESANFQPVFVTNGELKEDVLLQFQDFNRQLEANRRNKVLLIRRPELLKTFTKNFEHFFPSEIKDMQQLLRYLTIDGKEPCDGELVSKITESYFGLHEDKIADRPETEIIRLIASGCVLVHILSRLHAKELNHLACVEIRVRMLASVIAIEYKYELHSKRVLQLRNLILDEINQSLRRYAQECCMEGFLNASPNSSLLESVNLNFIRVKHTGMLALALLSEPDSEIATDLRTLLEKNLPSSIPFCEAQMPFALAIVLVLKKLGSKDAVPYLYTLVVNYSRTTKRLNPYYTEQKFIELFYQNFIENSFPDKNVPFTSEVDEELEFRSYYLKSIVHLFVCELWRKELSELWSNISKYSMEKTLCDDDFSFFLANTEKASIRTEILPVPTSWQKLLLEARTIDGKFVPKIIREIPMFGLLFLCFFPYRVNEDIVKFLVSELGPEINDFTYK